MRRYLGFATTTLLLFILSFLYEGLQNFKTTLDNRIAYAQRYPLTNGDQSRKSPFTISQNLIRSILHAFSYYFSQVLMMIFMAYNGYFCLSLVSGRLFGYFFFAVFMPVKPQYDNLGNQSSFEAPKSCCG